MVDEQTISRTHAARTPAKSSLGLTALLLFFLVMSCMPQQQITRRQYWNTLRAGTGSPSVVSGGNGADANAITREENGPLYERDFHHDGWICGGRISKIKLRFGQHTVLPRRAGSGGKKTKAAENSD